MTYFNVPTPAIINPVDNKRVIYIGGSHGSGKSTLIDDLKMYDRRRVREQLAHMEGLTDNINRQIWRATLHCIEHRENLVYASTQPENSVVIGDRSFLDDFIYMSSFVKLGWMTENERDRMIAIENLIYKNSNTPKPENFIILVPPLDWNIERIEERWQAGQPPKWCEMNFDYLKVVRNEFESLEFATNNNILSHLNILIIKTTDRKERIHKIKEWLHKNSLDDFITEGRTYVEGSRSYSGS